MPQKQKRLSETTVKRLLSVDIALWRLLPNATYVDSSKRSRSFLQPSGSSAYRSVCISSSQPKFHGNGGLNGNSQDEVLEEFASQVEINSSSNEYTFFAFVKYSLADFFSRPVWSSYLINFYGRSCEISF